MITRLTVERFKEAISGSGGVKSAICARVPCGHNTLTRWLDKHASLRDAYEDECDRMIGKAHSVIVGNIKAALAELETPGHTGQVDSGDARWYLSKMGKHEGFGDGPDVTVTQNVLTIGDFNKVAEARLKKILELPE